MSSQRDTTWIQQTLLGKTRRWLFLGIHIDELQNDEKRDKFHTLGWKDGIWNEEMKRKGRNSNRVVARHGLPFQDFEGFSRVLG